MARYVFKDGHFRDRSTGELMELPDRGGEVCVPFVRSDIEPYASPIDGRMITSMSERREDLKRNNCVDARDFPSPVKGFKNKRFAKKHGVEHLLREDAK